MIRAVFFDLDGTLIDYVSVARAISYFAEFSRFLGAELDLDEARGEQLINGAVGAMFDPHPGRSNQQAFDDYYATELGRQHDRARYQALFTRFFQDVFPTLQSNERPAAFNRHAVQSCRDRGLTVAIASQPIFCAAAIKARLAWAGLEDMNIPLASSSENAFTVKPELSYYQELASRLDLTPRQCLMVGNEDLNDMSASQVGMTTFYVGNEAQSSHGNHWSSAGTLADFVAELDSLIGQG
ncbi:MAG: HAD family hydrolase [Coriobacteriia bacterium]|nr:HAD family hydrolase [Coriobacteriia bacterium]